MTTTAPQTPAIFPAWFAARQQQAWHRHLATPAPKRGDETWRFSNIKQLDFEGFSRNAGVPPAANLLGRSTGLESPTAKFVFVNDTLIHAESHLPDGVVCLPLAEALVKHGELVAAHFMRQQTRLG
ncbi:MAG: hypothetical protein NTV46_14240, partial [Verrucomicrobia bacterium]|nr:hypothetical protein [Verrucomicrobiota bacterium]